MDVTQTNLAEIRNAIASGQMRSADVTRAYLDRIERYNGTINAYTQVFSERAMQRAQAVDAGEVTGPLAGVPVAVKDNIATTFGCTTCGSKMLENFRSPYDATVVRQLEESGAVILGKLNLDEFAMGSTGERSTFGPTRNPWNTDHAPGGSSGGAGAAVAADLAAAALASDTGGSIRMPAAWCGVVGLKPTYGLVSRFGLVAYASSLDQIGPITRTVEDAAILLQTIAGHDENDSTSAIESVSGPIPDYVAALNESVAGKKLGIAKQYRSEGNHPAVTAALDRAASLLADRGAEVVEVDLPHTEYGVPTYYLVATAEASSNLARYDGVHYGHRTEDPADLIDLYAASRAEGFGDEVKRRIMLGTFALSSGYYDAYYLRALKVRRLIKQDFDAAFQRCDAILCPTTTGPAVRIGQASDDPLAMYLMDVYTVTCNVAGIPGISIPGGLAETDCGKLPIGLQLLGPYFRESTLFALAGSLEKEMNSTLIRPDEIRI